MNQTMNLNYTETLSIEEFKQELLECRGNLEEKLALFRNQFPMDPLQFDSVHTSQ